MEPLPTKSYSSIPTIASYCDNPVPNTCDFYMSCLEEKFHCGPKGYPINYGNNNCEKFVISINKFSPAGKKWVTNVMLCLQRKLVSSYDNNETTCTDIYNTAFGSHAPCYIASGICILPPTDWEVLFEIIGFKTFFGNLKIITANALLSTFGSSQKYVNRFAKYNDKKTILVCSINKELITNRGSFGTSDTEFAHFDDSSESFTLNDEVRIKKFTHTKNSRAIIGHHKNNSGGIVSVGSAN
ncbi:4611_t:CDS:2, partial [Acaulospora morrowiae]